MRPRLPNLAIPLATVFLALAACTDSGSGSGGFEPPPGWTYTPSNPTKLLFLSNRPGGSQDGNYDVYLANLDGSGVQRHTDFGDRSIRFFDKHKTSDLLVIAYSTDGDLTIGPSGNHGGAEGGEQVLALLDYGGSPQDLVDVRDPALNPMEFTGVWHPTFSPDGTHIAFSGARAGESANLYRIRVDGTELVRIFDDPQRTYNDPRYGPDGRLVYVRQDNTGLGQVLQPDALDVWMVDPANPGSAVRVCREDRIPGEPRIETDPAMSPDARYVVSIRATHPFGFGTLLRPLSDNAAFPLEANPTNPIEYLQRGSQPDRVHGVPTWITPDELLSYRWQGQAGGWRIIRYGFSAPDGQVTVLDLGCPLGSEDLMPLAY